MSHKCHTTEDFFELSITNLSHNHKHHTQSQMSKNVHLNNIWHDKLWCKPFHLISTNTNLIIASYPIAPKYHAIRGSFFLKAAKFSSGVAFVAVRYFCDAKVASLLAVWPLSMAYCGSYSPSNNIYLLENAFESSESELSILIRLRLKHLKEWQRVLIQVGPIWHAIKVAKSDSTYNITRVKLIQSTNVQK